MHEDVILCVLLVMFFNGHRKILKRGSESVYDLEILFVPICLLKCVLLIN